MDNISLLIRKAKLKLFTKELIFFGMCAHKFEWAVHEFNPAVEGYVKFNEKDLSKIESGTINLNQKYLDKPNYTHNNLTFLICHELLHILNKHGLRIENRIPEIWNVAADHVIEVFLRSLSGSIEPFQNRYNIIQPIIDDLGYSCTVEQAYDWLINHVKIIGISVKSDGDGVDVIEVTDAKGNILFTTDMIQNINNTTNSEEDAAIQHQIEQFVSEARAILENVKQKGDVSGNLSSYLTEILKVEIPWEKLVEKSIKTNVIMKPDERNWRQLNKFFIPHHITLPGYSFIEDHEGTGRLIIGGDTSGSITDKNLKKFSYVVQNSMMHFKEVWLFTHDVHIQQVKIFDKQNIDEFYKFIKNEGYRGRGGTSHRYLFDEIQKMWDSDKDELSMVISLTDMYSDIENIYKNYTWIKNNLPLCFIITPSGKPLRFENGYGDIVQIKMN
jgi:predicted metal-dependent peptidase